MTPRGAVINRWNWEYELTGFHLLKGILRRKHSAIVHSCCWEVAWNALSRPPLKNPELSRFTGYLVYLRPFAHKTPFDCETNDVDHELWAETPSHARIESGGEQETRGVLLVRRINVNRYPIFVDCAI
jgi:hypothetical protein